MKKLLLVGNSQFAELAFEYFSLTNKYYVESFFVDNEFIKSKNLQNRPVQDINNIVNYNKNDYSVFVAVGYSKLNRTRENFIKKIQGFNFNLISYLSPHAFISPKAKISTNCFIFEENVIQSGVDIETGNILWSGNHIGHDTKIEKNCFISSHVVISGNCIIKSNSFLGVNTTVVDGITIEKDNWIDAGCLIKKNTKQGQIYRSNNISLSHNVDVYKFFKIEKKI